MSDKNDKNFGNNSRLISPEGVIRNRMMYYHQILYAKSVREKDSFVRPVSSLSSDHLRSNSEAFKHLYQNNDFIKFLCQNIIQHNDIELLIGGSTAIASIFKNDKIIPNDLDMYVKNCNLRKVTVVDSMIRDFFKKYHILMIRNPVNITWIIYDENNVIFQQIQLVIMQITSWSEIFITYHSDLTCVGFDVKYTQFVYLTQRWENILNPKYIHYFSNIVNLDTPTSLHRAVEKYSSRGFTCRVIEISIKDVKTSYNYGTYMSDPARRSLRRLPRFENPVLTFILEKYLGIDNICFSDRIYDLYNDSQPPLPVLDMADLGHKLLTIPSRISIPCTCAIGLDRMSRDIRLKERLNSIEKEKEIANNDNDSVVMGSSSDIPVKKSYADIAKAMASKPLIELKPLAPKQLINNTDTKKIIENDDYVCDCTCPIGLVRHRVFVQNSCGHKISLSAYIFNPLSHCPICRASFKPTQIVCPIDMVSKDK